MLHADDSEQANEYNDGQPSDDLTVYGPRVSDLVARVVEAMGTAADPEAYGLQARDALLPDVLSYNIGTAASFGFAGRNGRGLADNTPEVIFSIVLNTAVSQGLSSTTNSELIRSEFPYLTAPLATS